MSFYAQFSDLYGEVLDHGFSSSRYTQFAKDQINQAQHDIARRIDIRALATTSSSNTTSGTATINLPSDFGRERFVHDSTDDVPLVALTGFDEYQALDAASLGQPTTYVIEQSSIYLWPTPNGVYSILLAYQKTPTTLSADSDVPVVPLSYRNLLVKFAVAQCYMRENDEERASFFLTQYENGLLKMGVDLQHDAHPVGSQTPGPW